MRRDLEELWGDPKNWTATGYRCAEDPRLIVPKRAKAMGWTFNWAHPRASMWLALLLGTALLPTLAVLVTVFTVGPGDQELIVQMVVGDFVLSLVGPGIVIVLALRASRD